MSGRIDKDTYDYDRICSFFIRNHNECYMGKERAQDEAVSETDPNSPPKNQQEETLLTQMDPFHKKPGEIFKLLNSVDYYKEKDLSESSVNQSTGRHIMPKVRIDIRDMMKQEIADLKRELDNHPHRPVAPPPPEQQMQEDNYRRLEQENQVLKQENQVLKQENQVLKQQQESHDSEKEHLQNRINRIQQMFDDGVGTVRGDGNDDDASRSRIGSFNNTGVVDSDDGSGIEDANGRSGNTGNGSFNGENDGSDGGIEEEKSEVDTSRSDSGNVNNRSGDSGGSGIEDEEESELDTNRSSGIFNRGRGSGIEKEEESVLDTSQESGISVREYKFLKDENSLLQEYVNDLLGQVEDLRKNKQKPEEGIADRDRRRLNSKLEKLRNEYSQLKNGIASFTSLCKCKLEDDNLAPEDKITKAIHWFESIYKIVT